MPHLWHQRKVFDSECPDSSLATLPSEVSSISLVYELIAARLADQSAQVDNLRARAGMFLSATAIATAFFGANLVKEDTQSGWFWIGLIAIVATVLLLIFVLRPRDGWLFGPKPRVLIDEYAPLDEEVAKAHLASFYTAWHEENKTPIKRLADCLTAASLTLMVGILSWAWELSDVL